MNIVITGATSGIGKALALHYATHETTLGLIGRRQELLSTVAERCQAQGAKVLTAPIDVRDEAVMRDYAEQFIDQAGGIDIVIANAGGGWLSGVGFLR